MRPVEVALVLETGLTEPLALLEESLRGGEPVPAAFTERLRRAVATGEIEVLTARAEGRMVGVAVLAYRLSVSAGGLFASIEDLYVRPEARRGGVGRVLLEAVGKRCTARGISYVEAQAEDAEAAVFYAACGYETEGDVRVLSKSYAL